MTIIPSNDTYIGQREEQQDKFYLNDVTDASIVSGEGGLAVVADGMGGMSHGNLASQHAIDVFHHTYAQASRDFPDRSVPENLLNSLNEANQEVIAVAKKQNMLEDMGTTLVAAVMKNDQLHWISVGDSRAYILREGELVCLTSDHNYENELIRQGLSKKDAERNPDAPALTSYLGKPILKEIDRNVKPFPLIQNDRILLCSDGLYGTISDEEIQKLMVETTPDECAGALINTVRERNAAHQDNVTITVLTVERGKTAAAPMAFLPTVNDGFVRKENVTEPEDLPWIQGNPGSQSLNANSNLLAQYLDHDPKIAFFSGWRRLILLAIPVLFLVGFGIIFLLRPSENLQFNGPSQDPGENEVSNPDFHAVNDQVQVAEDSVYVIDVLQNDSYTLSKPPQIKITNQPIYGRVRVFDQKINYETNPNANGTDHFGYALTSGELETVAVVDIEILSRNDAPVAESVQRKVNQGETITINLLDLISDIDSADDQLGIIDITEPKNGRANLDKKTGIVTYTANDTFKGIDTFNFIASDGLMQSAEPGIVTVNVSYVNQPPIAVDDVFELKATERTAEFLVLKNDSDPDGNTLKVIRHGKARHGLVNQIDATKIRYTQVQKEGENYLEDTFWYDVSDGDDDNAKRANVKVVIEEAVNAAPSAVADRYEVDEEAIIEFPVLENDTDPEEQTLAIKGYSEVPRGVGIFEIAGMVIRYTPAPNYFGEFKFSYEVEDERGASSKGAVTVNVKPIDDRPKTKDYEVEINSLDRDDVEIPYTSLPVNEFDADGERIFVISVELKSQYGCDIKDEGSVITYVIKESCFEDSNNEDIFYYHVNDGRGAPVAGKVKVVFRP